MFQMFSRQSVVINLAVHLQERDDSRQIHVQRGCSCFKKNTAFILSRVVKMYISCVAKPRLKYLFTLHRHIENHHNYL